MSHVLASQSLGITGLMTAAIAYRVKYRQTDDDGKVVRRKVFFQSAGVHPKNRGGVFPSGARCMSLCEEVLEVGFVKEEVSNSFVAVEETPLAEIRSRGADYVCGLEYNTQNCKKDQNLITCFSAPHNEVGKLLLGHNHMMLIIRAFVTRAKWALPTDETKSWNGMTFCDDKGRLSIDAVAGHANGKQLREVVDEGCDCEVLSYKMDIEEPLAASLISQALNKGSELAMRTTELTAVAVLKGEIIVQMSKDVGQRVAFLSVREKVRQELSNAADDPDLPELFDFLIHLGVGSNSYVDDLLEFGSCFVDSKKRQLRFNAFNVANKMCQHCPLAKIAVIKRSYRKKPTLGYCPSPESEWTKFDDERVKLLENMLRFFHADISGLVGALEPSSRNRLLANVDVAAADAFYTQAIKKPKVTVTAIQDALCEALQPMAADLQVGGTHVQKGAEWIKFEQNTEANPAVAAEIQMRSAAAVITFDEKSGAAQNQQRIFEEKKQKEKAQPVKLPWQTWLLDQGALRGATDADRVAVFTCLHAFHERQHTTDQPIDIVLAAQIRVVATAAVKAWTILLPPCVLKPTRIVESSEHPHAVNVTVKVARGTDEEPKNNGTPKAPQKNGGTQDANKHTTVEPADAGAEAEAHVTLRTTEFFVLPEFKYPRKKEPPAVAAKEPPAVAAAKDAAANTDPVWMWDEGGEDVMHPFWAVRRMTVAQLKHEQVNKDDGTPMIRFNCEFVYRTVTCVCISSCGDKTVNRTRLMTVPFLSNSRDLDAGEELVLELAERKKKISTPTKRSWREVVKEAGTTNKKAKEDDKTKKKTR